MWEFAGFHIRHKLHWFTHVIDFNFFNVSSSSSNIWLIYILNSFFETSVMKKLWQSLVHTIPWICLYIHKTKVFMCWYFKTLAFTVVQLAALWYSMCCALILNSVVLLHINHFATCVLKWNKWLFVSQFPNHRFAHNAWILLLCGK